MDTKKKKEKTVVFSARMSAEIKTRFIQECKRLNIPEKYVISEYMKQFIVINADKKSYETATLFPEKKESDSVKKEI